jgi:hypothetical protein
MCVWGCSATKKLGAKVAIVRVEELSPFPFEQVRRRTCGECGVCEREGDRWRKAIVGVMMSLCLQTSAFSAC